MFKKLRTTIADIKTAFRLFISTVKDNTFALQALKEEQRAFHVKVDALVADSNFMATAKRNELLRAGHKH